LRSPIRFAAHPAWSDTQFVFVVNSTEVSSECTCQFLPKVIAHSWFDVKASTSCVIEQSGQRSTGPRSPGASVMVVEMTILTFVLWVGVAVYLDKRARRRRENEAAWRRHSDSLWS
jgi:ABC-type phosphate transport system permease subunit